ncbi:aldo/keto reductase [Fulvivirga sp. 29W222]|uniref:Aldo/keto reductase n=1 Tax=Fulvivirga marina TaxID=2494733 RepID=A0A937KCR6_9BACT|nr:aldo/keto reductase [Fulvivirga marina]MBL6447679.1 aldo/keto reductase [Fulvivirga marina]
MKRRIGNSDLEVFPIGLGTMGMSEFYGQTNEEQSISTIHKAIELGVDFFDTADMYGSGHNEELLGKALKGKFDKITLATKFANMRGPNGEFLGINGKPEYVRQACEASLKRLGIDTIDLYYYHRVDPEVPIEETVGAMAELVKEGKVRYLGLSEVNGETLRRAHAVHPISAVQSEYSIWTRDIEEANLKECRELGVTTVAYSPLGRGILTGKFNKIEDPNDYRYHLPRMQTENFNSNKKIVEKVEEIAASKNAKASQIALAWVLAKGKDIIPIPGTKREKYLIENLGALKIELTNDEISALDELYGLVKGNRYDDYSMTSTLQ